MAAIHERRVYQGRDVWWLSWGVAIGERQGAVSELVDAVYAEEVELGKLLTGDLVRAHDVVEGVWRGKACDGRTSGGRRLVVFGGRLGTCRRLHENQNRRRRCPD